MQHHPQVYGELEVSLSFLRPNLQKAEVNNKIRKQRGWLPTAAFSSPSLGQHESASSLQKTRRCSTSEADVGKPGSCDLPSLDGAQDCEERRGLKAPRRSCRNADTQMLKPGSLHTRYRVAERRPVRRRRQEPPTHAPRYPPSPCVLLTQSLPALFQSSLPGFPGDSRK